MLGLLIKIDYNIAPYVLKNAFLFLPLWKIRELQDSNLWGGFVSAFVKKSKTYINNFYNFRRIVYSDLNSIAPEQYYKQITNRLAEIKAVSVSCMFNQIINLTINSLLFN